jgi:hypothetical protein
MARKNIPWPRCWCGPSAGWRLSRHFDFQAAFVRSNLARHFDSQGVVFRNRFPIFKIERVKRASGAEPGREFRARGCTDRSRSLQKETRMIRTPLDLQIEELQHMVETRLALCPVSSQGVRCTLPAYHQPAEEHRFEVHFLSVTGTSACQVERRKASSAWSDADSSNTLSSFPPRMRFFL